MDIAVTIPKTSINSYTVYHVQVELPLRKYEVAKRYSDFVKLVADMETEVAAKCPVELPPKSKGFGALFGADDPELVEERRLQFEKMLAWLVREPMVWRQSHSFQEFLELPPGVFDAPLYSVSVPDDMSGSQWLEVATEAKGLLRQARQNAFSHQFPVTRKYLYMAKAKFGPLEDALKAATGLGDGELRRRKDLLQSLQTEYTSIESLQHGKSTIPGSYKGRVLGKYQETQETWGLNDPELLQQQKTVLETQDEELEQLRKIVQYQKQMGLSINEELDYQNDIIKDLDQHVDKTSSKIKYATQKTRKING